MAATATVIATNHPYYTIRVVFDGQSFDQTVITDLSNGDRAALLQSYADEYEAAWTAANAPADPDPE